MNINFSWRMMAIGLLLVALVAAGKIASHYRDKYHQADKDRTAAELLVAERQSAITRMQTRQRYIAELDAKYTKELADAKAKNDALQRKLDNGGRVLVKGKCPVSATTKTTSASSVGDDVTLELTSTSGRNVLGIRSGIISDQTSLRALQNYIRDQCLR